MKLGYLLKCWRTMNMITSREAARQIGIGLSTYSRIENGETMDGVTLAKIINWTTSPPEEEKRTRRG